MKPDQRRELRALLRSLPGDERSRASAAIRGSLLRHRAVREARCIATFDPIPGEPDLAPFQAELAAACQGAHTSPARFAFPRRESDGLAYYVVNESADLLPVDGYRFREPDPDRCERISPAEINVILVPGLAFAPSGEIRLGRGGGWYDRLLADPNLEATRLGVCFALQLRDNLPRDPHDQGVDEVITEACADP